jgi:hypothetical protein
MSKFLIAISSCQHDQQVRDHDVVRETWGKVADEYGVPWIINIGGDKQPILEAHEVYTKVKDDWSSLTLKTIANCKMALNYNYDFVFQCFRDTYISVPRLVKEFPNIQNQDVVGNFYFHNFEQDYACGGSGYWMSKKFMELLVKDANSLKIESEDVLVGEVMKKNKIVGYHDSRYDHLTLRGGVSKHNNNISNHLWSWYMKWPNQMGWDKYDTDWMRQEQRKELTGQWTAQDIKRRELYTEKWGMRTHGV